MPRSQVPGPFHRARTMQIIESTPFGVRSALLHLEAGDGAPRFLLCPMIHIADPDFYVEIGRRLEACDLILCEGVQSPTSSLLTLSYRFCVETPRLGLVSQKDLKLGHLKERLIHADVAGAVFDRRWWDLKTWWRFLVPLVAPIYGLHLRYFGTRTDIARGLGMNLRKSGREVLAGEDYQEMLEVILDWRDRRLIDVIEEQRLKQGNAGLRIAVLYGAKHMRAVLRHLLDQCGYRVAKSEWTTVFEL